VTQPEWPGALIKVIGSQVKRYRTAKRPRMSAQALSDATNERGLLIKRSVLANLESGRKTSLAVEQLLVLADVLGVPPVLLMVDVDADEIEIVPDRTTDPWFAAMWIAGNGDRGLFLARTHAHLVADWQAAGQRIAGRTRPAGLGADPMAQVVADNRRSIETAIRNIRVDMRANDLRPPVLPPELTQLDDEAPQ
jgi:transcriptional regulator with XRE-family HTH domain